MAARPATLVPLALLVVSAGCVSEGSIMVEPAGGQECFTPLEVAHHSDSLLGDAEGLWLAVGDAPRFVLSNSGVARLRITACEPMSLLVDRIVTGITAAAPEDAESLAFAAVVSPEAEARKAKEMSGRALVGATGFTAQEYDVGQDRLSLREGDSAWLTLASTAGPADFGILAVAWPGAHADAPVMASAMPSTLNFRVVPIDHPTLTAYRADTVASSAGGVPPAYGDSERTWREESPWLAHGGVVVFQRWSRTDAQTMAPGYSEWSDRYSYRVEGSWGGTNGQNGVSSSAVNPVYGRTYIDGVVVAALDAFSVTYERTLTDRQVGYREGDDGVGVLVVPLDPPEKAG